MWASEHQQKCLALWRSAWQLCWSSCAASNLNTGSLMNVDTPTLILNSSNRCCLRTSPFCCHHSRSVYFLKCIFTKHNSISKVLVLAFCSINFDLFNHYMMFFFFHFYAPMYLFVRGSDVCLWQVSALSLELLLSFFLYTRGAQTFSSRGPNLKSVRGLRAKCNKCK